MKTYEKALDPAFWQRVRREDAYAGHREDLKKQWEEFCTAPIEDIHYSQFKQYYETGDRRSFEKYYFARRQGLNAAALMALIWPEKPEYLTRAMDQIYAICNEYTWVLPAHQKSLEAFNPVHIDLFAAETALNLSEVYILLGQRLEPMIRRRVEQEIRRRILEPYLARKFGWETEATNWTSVCTCGVAISLMNVLPQEARKLVQRFEDGAASFLSGYGDDGYCPEGPMYWGYGFGFFTAYADRVLCFAGIDHFQNPKVERMAAFFQKKYLSGAAEVTFADADMGTRYSVGIQHYLHNRYPGAVTVPPACYGSYTDRMARMCLHLRSFMWFDPAICSAECMGEHFGADVQWLIVRKASYGFAAKAGHNDEPHNHNDVGSFIFAKNGRQLLTDPGRGQYVRDYFLPETRYDFLHTSSRGHSVPLVGTQQQKPGREFAARRVSWDGKTFAFDMAQCYGLAELKHLQRSFTVLETGVELTDRIEGSLPVTERFVATEAPAAEPGKLRFSDGALTFTPAVLPQVERVEETVEGGVRQTLYRIDIPLPEGTEQFCCRMG